MSGWPSSRRATSLSAAVRLVLCTWSRTRAGSSNLASLPDMEEGKGNLAPAAPAAGGNGADPLSGAADLQTPDVVGAAAIGEEENHPLLGGRPRRHDIVGTILREALQIGA